MTVEIQLTRGLVSVIDDCDFVKVAGIRFNATKGANTWYAVSPITGPLHRFLLNAPRAVLVDHRDNNGLNNRRGNLRFCTRRQNGRNRTGAARTVGRTSSYLGVSWSKHTENWRAVICAGPARRDGELSLITIGRFVSSELAARAFDAAAWLCFGEFAHLNFPSEPPDLDLLKKRLKGEIERVSSGRFRLRVNSELIGMFDERDEAEAARILLPVNSDESRLRDYAHYLEARPLRPTLNGGVSALEIP